MAVSMDLGKQLDKSFEDQSFRLAAAAGGLAG